MSYKQITFVLLAVAALVFGVTLLKVYTPSDETTQNLKPPPGKKTKLVFPQTEAHWGNKPPGQRPEFEVKKPGSYAFYFENPSETAVQLGVAGVSCKCSHIDVCIWPEEWKVYSRLLGVGAAAAALVPESPLGLLGGLATAQEALAKRPPDPVTDWRTLNTEAGAPKASRELTVPGGAAGWVRLSWNSNPSRLSENIGIDLFWAEMWVHSDEAGTRTRLEVPLLFVEPVRLNENTLALGELGPYPDRPRAEKSVLVWSSTRPRFALQAAPSSDPCVTVSEPVPLTPEEVRKLAVGEQGQMVAGYRVTVTVREQADSSARLDIGLFNRKVTLTSDPNVPPLTLFVNGAVRGEVAVTSGENKDYLALGSFRSRFGTEVTAAVTSDRSDLQLEIVKEMTPDFLEVNLEEVKSTVGKAWSLSVKALPGRVEGELKGQAVYLKTKSTPPRRIRIPVIGNAYN